MGKKSSAPAPLPDPAIGQAAATNAALGKEWLEFSKQQYKDGEGRQDDYDALIKQVTDSQLSSQDTANQWAAEDRQIQSDYRQKFDGWSDEDRALGRQTMGELDALGREALDGSKMYEQIYGDQAKKQSVFADEEMGRYKDTFRPIQDRLAADSMSWDSDERLASEAAKAKGDVVGNATAMRQANQRQMTSMGVNPNSGRFAGVERATDTATALAAAGAQNTTRDNVRSQGIQLRGQAAQVGQQVLGNGQQANQISLSAVGAGQQARLAGQTTAMQAKNMGLAAAGIGNTSAGLSVGNQGAGYQGLSAGSAAGSSAVGNAGAGNANFFQNGSVMAQGFTGAMQGATNSGNMLNNLYGNQLQGYAAQQQASGAASAGIGSMVGTIGGAAITAF